jgi:UDP-N-acetylglucosamine 2-epimerase
MGIKLVHIEAGLRSNNKEMPEEINRILVDHMANILCCPIKSAVTNLIKENIITSNIYVTGNLQLNLLQWILENYEDDSILIKNNLEENDYILMTVHRKSNCFEKNLKKIVNELQKMDIKIFFPIHPRTKKELNRLNIILPPNVIVHDPVSYPDIVMLMKKSFTIITDSGGIQPEATYLKKYFMTLREETEWVDTIESGFNTLVKPENIKRCYEIIKKKRELCEKMTNNKLNQKDCANEIVNILKNI